ncbi:MAG: hypothetical protein L6Q59_17360, partial [Ignavibacteriaceae bacterium]|nr:hypothetical protein [Ignavibacteriaceae bacterium]
FSRIFSLLWAEDKGWETHLGGAFGRRKHCVSTDVRRNHWKCQEYFVCQKTAASRRGGILLGVAFLQLFNPSRVDPRFTEDESVRDAMLASRELGGVLMNLLSKAEAKGYRSINAKCLYDNTLVVFSSSIAVGFNRRKRIAQNLPRLQPHFFIIFGRR